MHACCVKPVHLCDHKTLCIYFYGVGFQLQLHGLQRFEKIPPPIVRLGRHRDGSQVLCELLAHKSLSHTNEYEQKQRLVASVVKHSYGLAVPFSYPGQRLLEAAKQASMLLFFFAIPLFSSNL